MREMVATADTGEAVFRVFIGSATSVEVPLDGGDVSTVRPIAETQQVGFEVAPFEPDTEYRVRLGNAQEMGSSEVQTSSAVRVIGRRLPRSVSWEFASYFESARGRVALLVESRGLESGIWRRRAMLPFAVIPSKLGEERYQAMLSELSGLAAGLVLDLVSKSRIALRFSAAPGSALAGSSQLELRTLDRVWRSLSTLLEEIGRDPVAVIRRREQVRECWGGERHARRGVRQLVGRGIDVRSPESPRPFVSLVEMMEETTATLEHGRIAGVLEELEERALSCALSAETQIRALERERPFRDVAVGSENLYSSVDLPRIRLLGDAAERARTLRRRIREARTASWLRGVRPTSGDMQSPVFEHVAPYRKFREVVANFRRSASVFLADGEDEQLKSTARMYEQWVLLQLVAALRETGLRTESAVRLFRGSGRRRFTLDIERGAQVEFRSRDGRIVLIRYEPWVLPRTDARTRRDTVYRGRESTVPWSPDVLLEVLRDDAEVGVPNSVEYAVAVDAKYSRRIEEDHWAAARRYLEIKSTRTDRQVVYQSWLAYPTGDDSIAFQDDDVQWTLEGPSLIRGDRAMGKLPMQPDPMGSASEVNAIRPTARAREFVRGLLTYLDFPEVTAKGMGEVAEP